MYHENSPTTRTTTLKRYSMSAIQLILKKLSHSLKYRMASSSRSCIRAQTPPPKNVPERPERHEACGDADETLQRELGTDPAGNITDRNVNAGGEGRPDQQRFERLGIEIERNQLAGQHPNRQV